MDKWLEVLKKINELQKENKILWFRGHRNNEYKLNSGLFRLGDNLNNIKSSERNIYNYFVNYGYSYIEKFVENKEWNTLFLMQHYGLPTRLLDWTDSFIKALYFANLGRNIDEDACIWVLNPLKLNKACKELGLYEKSESGYNRVNLLTADKLPKRINKYVGYFESDANINSFAILPSMSNERLKAQNGFFTVQGNLMNSLEEEYSEHINEFLYKIELPNDTLESSMDFLKVNGINYYSIYGGVDGLCKYIKDELLKI